MEQFFLLKKSHKVGLLDVNVHMHLAFQELENKKILKQFKKFIELNIGDILIHHCLVVHGSKKFK